MKLACLSCLLIFDYLPILHTFGHKLHLFEFDLFKCFVVVRAKGLGTLISNCRVSKHGSYTSNCIQFEGFDEPEDPQLVSTVKSYS